MAHPVRLELTTFGSGGRRAIHYATGARGILILTRLPRTTNCLFPASRQLAFRSILDVVRESLDFIGFAQHR